MVTIWIAAAVIFIAVEAATVGLISIWFAFGAVAALVSTFLGGEIWLQIVVFLIVSAAAMYITKPIVKKYVNPRKKPTNADRLFAMVGLVTEEIDNIANTGTIAISGQTWTARSQTGENIAVGEKVQPVSIEGVKLIVAKSEKTELIQK